MQIFEGSLKIAKDIRFIGGFRGGAKEAVAPLFFLYFQNVFVTTEFVEMEHKWNTFLAKQTPLLGSEPVNKRTK